MRASINVSGARPIRVDPVRMDDLTCSLFCSQSRPTMRPTVPPDYPDDPIAEPVHRGRGALSNESSRYDNERRIRTTDGWETEASVDPVDDEELPPLRTTLTLDATRTIIARNNSPDIGFDRSINPYRGCEHGCIYCFARPTHAYLGLSPGLDFETKSCSSPTPPSCWRRSCAAPKYRRRRDRHGHQHRSLPAGRARAEDHAPDPRGAERVQPSGRHRHQGPLILRDLDILGRHGQAQPGRGLVSITTLDKAWRASMEPRARRRTAGWRRSARSRPAGMPTGVMTAPMIPALNDHEMEAILRRRADAGATRAGYVVAAPAARDQGPVPGMAAPAPARPRQAA